MALVKPRHRYPAVLLALALTGAGCLAGGSQDPNILVLGKQTLHRSDFVRHLRSLEARGVEIRDASVRRAALDAFIEERLLVMEARTRGLLEPTSTADDEQRAVRKLLYEDVLSKIEPGEGEIAGYYTQHVQEFAVPETVTLRQILVPSENEARDIRRRVQRDPKNFEILARSLSRSPEAGKGGLLGSFARGELPPELERAAFVLAPGVATEIVSSPHGYHVLRVDAHTPERVRTLEECRGEVRDGLLRRKQDATVRTFVRALMSRAKVDYDAAQTDPDRP
jgi:parvulin-like peptidyl-prolyl isomerase